MVINKRYIMTFINMICKFRLSFCAKAALQVSFFLGGRQLGREAVNDTLGHSSGSTVSSVSYRAPCEALGAQR